MNSQHRKQMILDALDAQSLTQHELAVLLGRSPTTIQNWVNGSSIPELTPQETAQLCQVMNCSLEKLVQFFPGLSRRRDAIKKSLRQKTLEN